MYICEYLDVFFVLNIVFYELVSVTYELVSLFCFANFGVLYEKVSVFSE